MRAQRDEERGRFIDVEAESSEDRAKSFSLESLFESGAKALEVRPLIDELTSGEDLGKRGEWWFAAQLWLVAALLFPPAPLEELVRVAGSGVALGGVVLAAAGLQSLGNSLSPLPAPRRADDHSLITTGVYQYARHPMYGGLLLLAFGLSAATASDLRFAASFALYLVLEQKVKLEEQALEERYGDEYRQYCRKSSVRKFIPWIL